MKPVTQPVATGGILVHVFSASALTTAGLMLATAGDLGPIGPLVIAQALYLAAFALTAEVAIAAAAGLQAVRRRLATRRTHAV